MDGAFVYWAETQGGNVMKVPVGGGAPIQLASAQPSPSQIAIDANDIYWTSSAGQLTKVALGGGTPVPLFTVGGGLPGHGRRRQHDDRVLGQVQLDPRCPDRRIHGEHLPEHQRTAGGTRNRHDDALLGGRGQPDHESASSRRILHAALGRWRSPGNRNRREQRVLD